MSLGRIKFARILFTNFASDGVKKFVSLAICEMKETANICKSLILQRCFVISDKIKFPYSKF
jgi:hypothetical protein